MAFAGHSAYEMPARQPKRCDRKCPGVGPDTARYGWVRPNELAQRPAPLRHREALRCAGDDRARNRCACGSCLAVSPCPEDVLLTGAADGVSLRVFDASLPGAWSQVPLGNRSRGRPAAGGEARACRCQRRVRRSGRSALRSISGRLSSLVLARRSPRHRHDAPAGARGNHSALAVAHVRRSPACSSSRTLRQREGDARLTLGHAHAPLPPRSTARNI